MKDGSRSRTRIVDNSGLLVPELVGSRFGSLTIVSRLVEGSTWNLRVEVKCDRCSQTHMGRFHNMRKRPGTAACPHCNPRRPLTVPKWIYQRCQAQQDRCNNPNSSGYPDYGGRGIKFLFADPHTAALWVVENLGIPADRSLQLDRIKNEGHYEPGNLRWVTQVINMNNTRKSGARVRFETFRKDYPHVMYADATLRRMIAVGLTNQEIIERWNAPSYKPKGKYGTFTTQGPYKGSLQTEG